MRNRIRSARLGFSPSLVALPLESAAARTSVPEGSRERLLLHHHCDSMTSPDPSLRVLSLLPSATEIVCRVGGEANLVGRSHECDWPAAITHLPSVTSSKVSLSLDSARIDRDVRELLTHALAVYDIDTDALRELRPDVIVTQDLCDVCAVSYEDVQKACAQLLPDARIVNLHPTRWAEVMDDIGKVADALGVDARGAQVVAELEQRKAEVA